MSKRSGGDFNGHYGGASREDLIGIYRGKVGCFTNPLKRTRKRVKQTQRLVKRLINAGQLDPTQKDFKERVSILYKMAPG